MTPHPDWLLAIVRPGDRPGDAGALMRTAIGAAQAGVAHGGGPFGALVVTPDGEVVAAGTNEVHPRTDPTAHAEVIAIRRAAHGRGAPDLRGLVLVTTCAPCILCTGAIHWARLDRVVAGARPRDAEAIGFVEGPPGFDGPALLRGQGVRYEPDVERDAAVALLRSYSGPIY